MKNYKPIRDSLRRANQVLTGDRMGVTAQIEDVLAKHVTDTLGEFFSLNGFAKAKINATKNGFEIIIYANAKSVKQLKML